MWRFINTGRRRGKFNMEFDEFLAKQLAGGSGIPTVRVYGWEPYAVSLGFHQRESEIDTARCRALGIDVVRRPSGGRAILHAHEITYSVILHARGRSVREVYERISAPLVNALRLLGIEADVTPKDIEGYDLGGEGRTSCFASTSRFEIQVNGKKIVGSAQRRYTTEDAVHGDIVLQHGSILLGPQHRQLADLVASGSSRLKTILEARTTEAETILGWHITFEEAVAAVRRGFEETWSMNFVAEEKITHEHIEEVTE